MKKNLYIASAVLILGGMSLPAISSPECQISSGAYYHFYLTPPNGKTDCQTTTFTDRLFHPEVNARILNGFIFTNWSNDDHELLIYCGNDENNTENYALTTKVLTKWPAKSPIYQITCTKKAAASQ